MYVEGLVPKEYAELLILCGSDADVYFTTEGANDAGIDIDIFDEDRHAWVRMHFDGLSIWDIKPPLDVLRDAEEELWVKIAGSTNEFAPLAQYLIDEGKEKKDDGNKESL